MRSVPAFHVPGAALSGRRGAVGFAPRCESGERAGWGGRMRVVRVLGALEPGYWEVTSLYAVARALGAERILALGGIYVELDALSSNEDTKFPERSVEEAVRGALGQNLFCYHRLALAEAVLDRVGDELRRLTYPEFLRRYEDPEWNLKSLLEPSRQAFGSLSKERLKVLEQSLKGLSKRIQAVTLG